MSNFDKNFEANCLAILAKQHPDVVKVTGEVVFRAEDDEDLLSVTRWKVQDEIFEMATESGFKLYLNNFIRYRGQCNELPKKEGVVRFGDGGLSIEWLPDGSTHLWQR